MARFLIIEIATGKVTNAIEWDGVAEYDPGAAFMLVKSDLHTVGEVVDTTHPDMQPVEYTVPQVGEADRGGPIPGIRRFVQEAFAAAEPDAAVVQDTATVAESAQEAAVAGPVVAP